MTKKKLTEAEMAHAAQNMEQTATPQFNPLSEGQEAEKKVKPTAAQEATAAKVEAVMSDPKSHNMDKAAAKGANEFNNKAHNVPPKQTEQVTNQNLNHPQPQLVPRSQRSRYSSTNNRAAADALLQTVPQQKQGNNLDLDQTLQQGKQQSRGM